MGWGAEGIHIKIFVISLQKHTCGYSLEAPCQDASNEYPQCMFSWRNKKNISSFWLKKVPCADSKGPDQTSHLRSLIRAFAVRQENHRTL